MYSEVAKTKLKLLRVQKHRVGGLSKKKRPERTERVIVEADGRQYADVLSATKSGVQVGVKVKAIKKTEKARGSCTKLRAGCGHRIHKSHITQAKSMGKSELHGRGA